MGKTRKIMIGVTTTALTMGLTGCGSWFDYIFTRLTPLITNQYQGCMCEGGLDVRECLI